MGSCGEGGKTGHCYTVVRMENGEEKGGWGAGYIVLGWVLC